jgi:hypothetical protein
MRTNSPIDESSSTILDEAPPKPKVPANDWEKLGKSGKYKQINQYLEARKEFYRKFLPGSVPIQNVPNEERAQRWESACTIIEEIENIQAQIALHSGKPLG